MVPLEHLRFYFYYEFTLVTVLDRWRSLYHYSTGLREPKDWFSLLL